MAYDKLEKECRNTEFSVQEDALMSIAISLKRIADALETFTDTDKLVEFMMKVQSHTGRVVVI
jgi:hypothetical protein